ncbi:MAG: response regulator, partial [Planctomycetales bacterium]|nr:response regulator [Planctomycetales bacterium]
LNYHKFPIVMGARLLEKNQPEENRRQLLKTIRTSAERGAEMIRQLLAFAGGEHGESLSVEVGDVLDEVTGILRHTLPKSIVIKWDRPESLWHVQGDPTELSPALMNLAINARDAMPSGGRLEFIAKNVELDAPHSAVGADLVPGAYVALTISDDGQGIPPEIIERVFDPFFTTKKQGQGTGLGLATSLGIVHRHGGSMTAYSEPHRGTSFTIYLPARPTNPGERLHRDATAPPSGAGQSLLVVDDELPLLDTARMVLEAAGYRVLAAHDGEEAVDLYRSTPHRIDAVIVDMMMPGMDGQAVIDAIRTDDEETPIIGSSGLRRPEHGEAAIRGTQAFLAKPYTDRQLLEIVADTLRSAAPRQDELAR